MSTIMSGSTQSLESDRTAWEAIAVGLTLVFAGILAWPTGWASILLYAVGAALVVWFVGRQPTLPRGLTVLTLATVTFLVVLVAKHLARPEPRWGLSLAVFLAGVAAWIVAWMQERR